MAENQIGIQFTGDASGLTASVGQANKALGSVKVNSNQAKNAITSLSRVAQDAPFGFIAIQNNLDAVIQSFSQSGISAKQFALALAGPAGLGLAFSVLTSQLTVNVQKYGSFSAALGALLGDFTDAKLAQLELNKALRDGVGAAQSEINTIQNLLSIARDKTLSTQAQQQAIDKLNKEYDKYLPKLTRENIDTQKVTDSVNNLSASLLKQAKIKGLQELITKEYQKQAEIIGGDLEDSLGFWDRLGVAIKSGGNIALQTQGNIVKGAQRQFEALTKSEQRIKNFNDVLRGLLVDEAQTGTLFADNVDKKLKEKVEKRKKELRNAFVTNNLANTDIPDPVNSFTGAGLFGKQDKPKWLIDLIAFSDEAKNKQQQLAESAKRTASIITDTLGGAFQNLFSDIISGSQNAFQSFASAIAQVITKLVAAALTAAVLAAIIGAATGGANFGGGAASFTSGFKGLFSTLSGLPKFANGGIVTGPTIGLVGEAGREAIIPLDRIGEVLGSVGGAQSVFVTGQLSGETIYLQQQRTANRRGRFV